LLADKTFQRTVQRAESEEGSGSGDASGPVPCHAAGALGGWLSERGVPPPSRSNVATGPPRSLRRGAGSSALRDRDRIRVPVGIWSGWIPDRLCPEPTARPSSAGACFGGRKTALPRLAPVSSVKAKLGSSRHAAYPQMAQLEPPQSSPLLLGGLDGMRRFGGLDGPQGLGG
jgi:hypothetical protein